MSFSFQSWSGSIIWLAVQGKFTISPGAFSLTLFQWYYSCAFTSCTVARRSFWSSWQHCSPWRLVSRCGSWSQPIFWLTVRHWLIAVRCSLSQILIFSAGKFVERISISGHYLNALSSCEGYSIATFEHIWIPCLVIDAILAAFAIWAGIQHSRQQISRLPRFTTHRLVDILIQGNVIYFLRYALSYPYWTGSENGMQSSRYICSISCWFKEPQCSVARRYSFFQGTNHDFCRLSPNTFSARGGFTRCNFSLEFSHDKCICGPRRFAGRRYLRCLMSAVVLNCKSCHWVRRLVRGNCEWNWFNHDNVAVNHSTIIRTQNVSPPAQRVLMPSSRYNVILYNSKLSDCHRTKIPGCDACEIAHSN